MMLRKSSGAFIAVHPRACGEHNWTCMRSNSSVGSSPRLRGTSALASPSAWRCRFIPAPAGNIADRASPLGSATVHPRACGEHNVNGLPTPLVGGSSPRLRGTFVVAIGQPEVIRFIPAPAGNIAVGSSLCSTDTVHPRACGEHLCIPAYSQSVIGSSPRLRGTSVIFASTLLHRRFIPAPAGNIWG